ncbi:MAG: TetR/AcrR family transcriptional regulator [Bermanella sp.]
MNSDTQQKIIDGARDCFSKHGFRASNMSLISRYAGFSRVTLHKHFKNKDRVFRAVCSDYQSKYEADCRLIVAQQTPCWQMIEQITALWSSSAFNQVENDKVLRELLFETTQVADDILEAARNSLKQMLQGILDDAVCASQISLHACQLNSQQLAAIIVASVNGIRSHFPREQTLSASQQLLELYRLATLSQAQPARTIGQSH